MSSKYPFYVPERKITFYNESIDYYPPHGIAVEKILILLGKLIEDLPKEVKTPNILDNLDFIIHKMEKISEVLSSMDKDSEEAQEYFNWVFTFVKHEGISTAYFLVQECFPGLEAQRLKKEDFMLLLNVALQDVMKLVNT